MFKDRSTFDIVVIILAATVGLTVMLVVLGVLLLKLFRPELDVKGAGALIGNILTTLVGALVGFIGGRSVGKMEANGAK